VNNKISSKLIKIVKILIFVITVSSALLYITNLKPDCKACFKNTHTPAILHQENIDEALTNKIVFNSIKQIQKIQSQNYNKIYSIPLITHHIYFTSNSSPTPIKESVVSNISNSISRLNNYNDKFIHYFWTNNPKIIPVEIAKIPNLIVKNINEFKKDKLYPHLISSIEQGQKHSMYFVQSSDILRIMSLYKYGGIYHDIDYEIYNADILMQYVESFDFIAGIATAIYPDFFYTSNAFIAASPKHDVITESKRIIQRNLDGIEPLPNYIKFPCSIFYGLINSGGPSVITVAIYKKLNSARDILLPAGMLIERGIVNNPKKLKKTLKNPPIKSFEGEKYISTLIGNDSFSCSWCTGSKERICYN
jgi:mannosyltransferase OCH1-like enzyme